MTQYPEVVLTRELGICYSSISIVTDYDAGLHEESGIQPVNAEDFLRVFNMNVEKVKNLIMDAIPKIPDERSCACKHALDNAKI